MEQTAARKLARQINDEFPESLSIAITEDHYHGRWEKTYVWMVVSHLGIFRSEEQWDKRAAELRKVSYEAHRQK